MGGKRITAALTSLLVAGIVGVLADDLSHFSYADLHEEMLAAENLVTKT